MKCAIAVVALILNLLMGHALAAYDPEYGDESGNLPAFTTVLYIMDNDIIKLYLLNVDKHLEGVVKMNEVKASEYNLSNLLVSDNPQYKDIGTNFKSILSYELTAVETFDDMLKSTIESYFVQSSQIFYHVMDASSISQEVWTHNDFPYEKFFTNEIDVSVLN